MNKFLFIILQVTLFYSNLFSQDAVSLTVSAQGKTKEEAKYNAFRDALERAFGTFISSNTQILNDKLIKDEIVSLTTGNIERFEIKSEILLPNGMYTNVIDVTVSIGKLRSFCESKGIKVEFQGSLFAANIKMEQIKKENEQAVVRNMYWMIKEIVENGIFNYSIGTGEPTPSGNDTYNVHSFITASLNDNIKIIESIIKSTISQISLTQNELSNLRSLKRPYYLIEFDGVEYYLRDWESVAYLRHFFERVIPYYSLHFVVSNNLYSYNIFDDYTSKIESDWRQASFQIYTRLTGFPTVMLTLKDLSYEICPNTQIEYYFSKISILGLDEKRDYSTLRREKTFQGNTSYLTNSLGDDVYVKVYFNKPVKLTFRFTEVLSLDEIEKISEYKVKPKR